MSGGCPSSFRSVASRSTTLRCAALVKPRSHLIAGETIRRIHRESREQDLKTQVPRKIIMYLEGEARDTLPLLG